MKIILQQVTIADPNSPHNGNKKDILIVDGIINRIDDHIADDAAQLFNTKDVIVTPGWVDIFSMPAIRAMNFAKRLKPVLMQRHPVVIQQFLLYLIQIL